MFQHKVGFLFPKIRTRHLIYQPEMLLVIYWRSRGSLINRRPLHML